jgi:hypothetical protein
MPTCEKQYIARDRSYPAYDSVCAGTDFFRSFAAGAAVTEKVPVGALRSNLCSAPPFVLAIVPFDKVRIHFGHRAKTRELTRPPGALQRTGVHLCQSDPLETFPQSPGSTFPALRKGNISETGMLA